MKTNIILLLAFTLLNYISWSYFGILMPIVLAILFYYLAQNANNSYIHFVLSTFSIFLLYNLSGAYWIINLDFFPFIIALLLNPVLLTFFLSFYFYIKKIKAKNSSSIIILIIISFEYYFNSQEYSFNWLNIGNVLGNQIYLAQFYSSIRSIGGSFYILIWGYIIYYFFINKVRLNYVLLITTTLSLPLLFSIIEYRKSNIYDDSKILSISCYSPEYLEKNDGHNLSKEIYKLLKANPDIDFIILPETTISGVSLSDLKKGNKLPYFKRIASEFPKTILTFGSDIKISKTKKVNSFVILDSINITQKIKTRYVPFLEYTPSYLELLGKSNYVKNSEDTTRSIVDKYNFLPLICYESFYSDNINIYKDKYDFIILITSESFFGDSDYGKKQYLNLIKLRAIESGKFIIKSAYKGISCVINEKGDIVDMFDEEKKISTIYRID